MQFFHGFPVQYTKGRLCAHGVPGFSKIAPSDLLPVSLKTAFILTASYCHSADDDVVCVSNTAERRRLGLNYAGSSSNGFGATYPMASVLSNALGNELVED